MKMAARARRSLLVVIATCLSACVYAPPVPPSSYAFARHPGVFVQVQWQYDYAGVAYPVSYLVNRGSVDKCAWTDALDSRLLRAGETWQIGQVQSPGNVVVTDVVSSDPNCVNAKREHR